MAITRTSSGALADVEIGKAKNVPEQNLPKIKSTNPKKRGFLLTTFDELRKSEWPTLSYVLKWTVVILIFTALISLFLGFFDHAFTSGFKFVDCTSKKQPLNSCSQDLVERLTFRK